MGHLEVFGDFDANLSIFYYVVHMREFTDISKEITTSFFRVNALDYLHPNWEKPGFFETSSSV